MALLDTTPKKLGAAIAAALAIAGSLVAKYEGTVPRVYLDPIGIVTACTGHVDKTLRLGETFTTEECGEMLNADLSIAAHGVQDCIDVPVSTNELAAYTSFAFNVGVDAFCSSTAARELNAGRHHDACEQLAYWTRAGGHVLPGLVRRRAAERSLCETP